MYFVCVFLSTLIAIEPYKRSYPGNGIFSELKEQGSIVLVGEGA
jgi:hypothetical protein